MNHIYKTILDIKTGVIKVVSERSSSNQSKSFKTSLLSKKIKFENIKIDFISPQFIKNILSISISTAFASISITTSYALTILEYNNSNQLVNIPGGQYNVLKSPSDENAQVVIDRKDFTIPSELSQPNSIYGGYKNYDYILDDTNVIDTSVLIKNTTFDSNSLNVAGAKISALYYGYDIDNISATATGTATILESSSIDSVTGASISVIHGNDIDKISATATGTTTIEGSLVNTATGASVVGHGTATSTGTVNVLKRSSVDYVVGASASGLGTVTSTGTANVVGNNYINFLRGSLADGFSQGYDSGLLSATSMGTVIIEDSLIDQIEVSEARSGGNSSVTSTGLVTIKGSSVGMMNGVNASASIGYGGSGISTGTVVIEDSSVNSVTGAKASGSISNAKNTMSILKNSSVGNVTGASSYGTAAEAISILTIKDSSVGNITGASSSSSTDIASGKSISNGTVTIENSSVSNVTAASASGTSSSILSSSATSTGTVNIINQDSSVGNVTGASSYGYSSGSTLGVATSIGAVTAKGGSMGSVTGASSYGSVSSYNSNSVIGSSLVKSTGTVVIEDSSVRDVIGASASGYGTGLAYGYGSGSSSSYGSATSTGTVTIKNSSVDSVTGSLASGHGSSSALGLATSTGAVVIEGSSVGRVIGASSSASSSATSIGTVIIKNSLITNVVGAEVESYSNNQNSTVNLNAQDNIVTLQGKDTQFRVLNLDNNYFNYRIEPETVLSGAKIIGNKDSFSSYNVFTGNTLNMESAPITVGNIGNFETYNFHINDSNAHIVNTDTALITVTNQLKNDLTLNVDGTSQENISKFKITGISGTYNPKNLDRLTLLALDPKATVLHGDKEQDNISTLFVNTNEKHIVDVGLTKKVEVVYDVNEEKNIITAKFKNDSEVLETLPEETLPEETLPEETLPPDQEKPTTPDAPIFITDEKRAEANLKPLAEGHLAGLMNVTRTLDLIANNILSGSDMNDGDYSPFVMFEGGHDRYNSGSHIKSTSYRGILGGKYNLNDFMLGGFVTYGDGNYDTYNSINTKEFNGTGNSRHYGLGLIAKYAPDATNYYIEGSLELGKSRNHFDSDIITGGGTTASFHSHKNYVSGHIGIGYIYSFNDQNTLNNSFKYLASHLGSDQVMIDGENINLHSLTSSRLQIKTEWVKQYTPTFGVIGTLGYEHEFDAKAGVSVEGYNLADQPSLKGGTGIGEIGLTYNPFKSVTNEFIDFRIKGSTGERDGISAIINLKHTF